MKKYFILLFLLYISQACFGQSTKINGVSFVASREAIKESHIKPVKDINANYAALMPFGFIKNLQAPEIKFNSDRQWFGETKLGIKQYAKKLQEKSVKIMIKPQLWVWHGEYTGHIKMNNEASWKSLENSYSKFITTYARVAQDLNAEIFCIGTELEQFITNRPKYWNQLILEIKKIYKGKLTYAANWDEFRRVPFWPILDFIGIDAYFPISKEKTPTVNQCKVGWKPYITVIREQYRIHQKPVLFTEFGYRSVNYTAKEPWNSDRNLNTVDLVGQLNATKALFEEFWNEDWFAGGFIWKWFPKHKNVGGINDNKFTPQNKPVEKLIKQFYAQ